MSTASPSDPHRMVGFIAGTENTSKSIDLQPIPGYHVHSELARGGMGRVLAATDLSLDREVAIKVLLPGIPIEDAVRRFIRESKITARLPHPGIPPVHALGQLQDGSPFLAMKLVRGRTLDQLLKSRSDSTGNLPHFLQVFEQICQAVGFAHTLQVIHRDLKPANVMVGAFGEVQVMDWGLAKETSPEPDAPAAHAYGGTPGSATAISRPSVDVTPRTVDETQPGDIVGTITYMPPEQAKGDQTRIGPWSDVFSLGGILCHILTGKPPYHGFPAQTLLVLAEMGDTEAAFTRLNTSGADPELISLCRRCLAKDPADRFADGSAVAVAIGAFRRGVDERLRTAEREAAAAEARTAEEVNTRREAEARLVEQRRKQRFQLALAAAIGFLLLGAAGFAWYRQWSAARQVQLQSERDREETEKQAAVARTRERVPGLLALATEQRRRYLFKNAAVTLQEARHLASSSLTDDLIPLVTQAEENLALVVELDEIRMRRAILSIEPGGRVMPDTRAAPPLYLSAFRRRGYELDSNELSELVDKVRSSPIRDDLIAFLDDWAVIETNPVRLGRLLEVAHQVDPGPWKDRFRNPAVRASSMRLWWLACTADPAALSPAILSALAELMSLNGLDPSRLLKNAQGIHPQDFLISFFLGQWYGGPGGKNDPLKQWEAIGHFRSARALRPDNFTVRLNLGRTLLARSDLEGAIMELRAANAIDANFSGCHILLGACLTEKGEWDEAVSEFKLAIKLDANYALSHRMLAQVLVRKRDFPEAIPEFERALQLDPKDAMTNFQLGLALFETGNVDGAIARFEAAIAINPKNADIHQKLGYALYKKGDREEAIVEYCKALIIDSDHILSYYGLGVAHFEKGDLDRAVNCFQTATRLDPTNNSAKQFLSMLLLKQARRDAAIAESFGIGRRANHSP